MLVFLSIAAFFLLYVLWFRLFYMFLWHPLCPFHNTHHSLIALFILQLLLFNLCFQKDATPWKQGLCLSYLLLLPSVRQMARLEEALMTIEWANIYSLSPCSRSQSVNAGKESASHTHIFSLWWVPFACKYWDYQDEPTPLGKAKFNTHKTHFPLSPNLCHGSCKSPLCLAMRKYPRKMRKDRRV